MNCFQSLPLIILSNWAHFILSGKKNPSVALNIETSFLLKKYLTCKLVGAWEYFSEVSLGICIDLILAVSQLSKTRPPESMGMGCILLSLFDTCCHSPSTLGKEEKKTQAWLCSLPADCLHSCLYWMEIQYNLGIPDQIWFYCLHKWYQIGKIQLKIRGRTKHHLTAMQLTTQSQTPRYEMWGWILDQCNTSSY